MRDARVAASGVGRCMGLVFQFGEYFFQEASDI